MAVYFIRAGANGPIKIGVTASSVLLRLRSIQTHNHEELILLGVLPGGHEVEREIHERFADHRVMRRKRTTRSRPESEWFTASPEIVDFIRSRSVGGSEMHGDGLGRKLKRLLTAEGKAA